MKKLITNATLIITLIITSINYSFGQHYLRIYKMDNGVLITQQISLINDGNYGVGAHQRALYHTGSNSYTPAASDSIEIGTMGYSTKTHVIIQSFNDTIYRAINPLTYELQMYLRKNIDGSLSVNEIEVSNLNVYPNPVIDVLNISFDSNENVDVIVMDMSGRIVHNEPSSTLISGINLSDQPSGMYLVKIGNQTQRIIKQ